MSRKRLAIISLALVCISLMIVVSYALNYNSPAKSSENQTEDNSSDLPEGPPGFVIPESL